MSVESSVLSGSSNAYTPPATSSSSNPQAPRDISATFAMMQLSSTVPASSSLTSAVATTTMISTAPPPLHTYESFEKFREQCELSRCVGSGGQGLVFAGKNRAWKIVSQNNLKLDVFAVLKTIQTPLSYHLLSVSPHYLFSEVSYHSMVDCVERKQVGAVNSYKWGVEEMDLMEGCLEKCPLKGSEKEVIQVIWWFTYTALKALGIEAIESDKHRNMLYRPLKDDDPLMQFDVWKYTFGADSVYVPKIPYLIKLGDMTSWRKIKPEPMKIPSTLMQKWKELFPPPSRTDLKVIEIV